MEIEWTSDMSTGVAWQDEQHKELFKRINDFLGAMSQGRGKDAVGGTVKFLEDYVVKHFGAEERHMKENLYVDYLAHKEQHGVFTKRFLDLKKELMEKGAGITIVLQAQRLLCDWLINHIGMVDKNLGRFMKAKGIKAA